MRPPYIGSTHKKQKTKCFVIKNDMSDEGLEGVVKYNQDDCSGEYLTDRVN